MVSVLGSSSPPVWKEVNNTFMYYYTGMQQLSSNMIMNSLISRATILYKVNSVKD